MYFNYLYFNYFTTLPIDHRTPQDATGHWPNYM